MPWIAEPGHPAAACSGRPCRGAARAIIPPQAPAPARLPCPRRPQRAAPALLRAAFCGGGGLPAVRPRACAGPAERAAGEPHVACVQGAACSARPGAVHGTIAWAGTLCGVPPTCQLPTPFQHPSTSTPDAARSCAGAGPCHFAAAGPQPGHRSDVSHCLLLKALVRMACMAACMAAVHMARQLLYRWGNACLPGTERACCRTPPLRCRGRPCDFTAPLGRLFHKARLQLDPVSVSSRMAPLWRLVERQPGQRPHASSSPLVCSTPATDHAHPGRRRPRHSGCHQHACGQGQAHAACDPDPCCGCCGWKPRADGR